MEVRGSGISSASSTTCSESTDSRRLTVVCIAKNSLISIGIARLCDMQFTKML